MEEGLHNQPKSFIDTNDSTVYVLTSSPTGRWQRVPPLYRQIVYIAPSAVAWLSWLIMIIDFLASYLNLRDPNGHIPRISNHYATFPYISCIGALHETYFRITCIVVAACVITSFLLDYHFGKAIVAGRLWRQIKVFWGIVTSIFLVAMSFASINDGGDLHLIFVSVHLWTAICAKICDFVSGILMRKVNKTNRHLIFAKRWKKAVGFVGAPCALITMIGIYGCDTNPTLTTPGSKCYKIVAVAAPAEWILALCFINYLMAMSYVLWNAESIRMETMRYQKERDAESNAELQTLVSEQLKPVGIKTPREAGHRWKKIFSLGSIGSRWAPKTEGTYTPLGH